MLFSIIFCIFMFLQNKFKKYIFFIKINLRSRCGQSFTNLARQMKVCIQKTKGLTIWFSSPNVDRVLSTIRFVV